MRVHEPSDTGSGTRMGLLFTTMLMLMLVRARKRLCLEGVVLQGSHQVSDGAVSSCHSLHNFSSGSEHGETAIGDLLSLQSLELVCVSLSVPEWVESEVTWGALSCDASLRDGDSGEGLDEHDSDEAGGDVLWVGTPDLPECVHLVLGGGHFASWGWSEDLNLEDSGDGEHGNTSMLDLGLAEPVEIDADLVDVGETEWVEANISCHGSIKERWTVHEWHGLAALGVEADSGPGVGLGWGKGRGRCGEEGGNEGGVLHHGDRVFVCWCGVVALGS
mmetsp:Transcript_22068/g.61418  ORF Transcript_22068/g.61418 Transcript_22068/m.61418 type:complete len:275 (+) Transcript_22068:255-1079(+)